MSQPSSDRDDVDDDLYGLDFDAAKSMRYHAHRRNFWQNWDHFTKVLSIISATAVVVTVFGPNKAATEVLALIVALSSTSDIVFGFGRRATLHDDLYRRFSKLQEDVMTTMINGKGTKADLAKFKARRLQIEREEPGTVGLLERRSAAEECLARGCQLNEAWRLNWFQWHTAQWSVLANPRSSTSAVV